MLPSSETPCLLQMPDSQLQKSKLSSFLQNSENPPPTQQGDCSGEAREHPVHNTTISFGAKGCKTCGAPSCAQPTVWRPGLRPLPHSLLQIHAPHPRCETAVWASKPFCSGQHALLGLDLFDSQSRTASLLCLNSSLWLFVVSVVSPEATVLESAR